MLAEEVAGSRMPAVLRRTAASGAWSTIQAAGPHSMPVTKVHRIFAAAPDDIRAGRHRGRAHQSRSVIAISTRHSRAFWRGASRGHRERRAKTSAPLTCPRSRPSNRERHARHSGDTPSTDPDRRTAEGTMRGKSANIETRACLFPPSADWPCRTVRAVTGFAYHKRHALLALVARCVLTLGSDAAKH